MRVLFAVDRWLHRVLRGHCPYPWWCEKLSYREAMRDIEKERT